MDPVRVLLLGVAVCHAAACASLYVQLPGLLGSHGVLPTDAFLNRVAAAAQSRGMTPQRLLPTLVWPLSRALPGGVDAALGALCLADAALSTAVATVTWRHRRPGGVLVAAALALMHVLYLSLLVVGQSFLSFQWDALLLEATFVAAVVAAFQPNATVPWLPRLTLFKLMLSSGVVKLNAGCPTWSQLTALTYHFATQPLPTPPAWLAAQLPAGVLRLACACALALEGPLAFLPLSPLPTARRFGAMCQVLFMVSIAVTGNYCFFNLLTAIFALACVDETSHASASAWERRASWMLICMAVGLSMACFSNGPDGLKLTLTAEAMNATLSRVLPMTMKLMFRCILPVATLQNVLAKDRSMRSSRAALARRLLSALAACAAGVATLVAGAIIAAPLSSLLPHDGAVTAALPGLPPALVSWANAGHVSSSYGLFRMMTGVGRDGSVARPELILQGRAARNSSSNEEPPWLDLPFRFKPGDTHRAPPWVAPHQPRLDWQMWFAALGPGPDGNSAWVVHLATLLLRGEPDVYGLLAAGPFTPRKPPMEVRIMAWSYAFTGWSTDTQPATAWWVRTQPRVWLSPLRVDSPELDPFLTHHGWPGAKRKRWRARKGASPRTDGILRGGTVAPVTLTVLAGAGLGALATKTRHHAKTD